MISNSTWFSQWITLEENSPCGIIRSIDFKFEGFSRVWVNEDWVGGYPSNKLFDSLGAGIIPKEASPLFEEAGEWFGYFGKILDKGPLVS